MATSPALVHDGSHCGCAGAAVLIHPLNDHFVCSACLAPYDEARVGMAESPVLIKASHVPIAVQSAFCDGSARALALAGLYPTDTRLAFVGCACGCKRLEAVA